MSVILSTLRDLARTLGCGDHQVETVVREEQSARAALSRRGLFKAAGAVAIGTVVSVPVPRAQLSTMFVFEHGELRIYGQIFQFSFAVEA